MCPGDDAGDSGDDPGDDGGESAIGGEGLSGGESFGGPGFGGGTDIGGEGLSGGEGFVGPGFSGATDIGGEQEATPGAFARAGQESFEEGLITGKAKTSPIGITTKTASEKAAEKTASNIAKAAFAFSPPATLGSIALGLLGIPVGNWLGDLTKEGRTTSSVKAKATEDETVENPLVAEYMDKYAQTVDVTRTTTEPQNVPATYAPDDPGGVDGGDYKAPRTRAIAARNNNVGLAVDDGDFTRKQLRRARRQITRFA